MDVWVKFLVGTTLCPKRLGCVPLRWSGSGSVWSGITRIMGDQMNRRIHSEQGFISSLDLPWSKWSRITDPDPVNYFLVEGGVRGVWKRQTAQKYAKKPQTASDFFPNTETARTCRPQYESWRQQDLWYILITLCVSIKHTIITLTIYCTTLLYSIYY